MKKFVRILDVAEIERIFPKEFGLPINKRLFKFFALHKEKFTYDLIEKRLFISSFFPPFPSPAWERFINAIERQEQGDRIPAQVDITITGMCHCNCWHCFRDADRKTHLDESTVLSCFRQLYDLGTVSIGITGGEPMLYQGINSIIRSIPDGMDGQLYTTGHLIDKATATELARSNITRCIISLDHFDSKVVAKMRGYPYAFEEALCAIKLFNQANLYVAVTVCVADSLLSKNDFEKYIDFATSLHVDEIRVVLPIPQGKLKGTDVKQLYHTAIHMVKLCKQQKNGDRDAPSIVLFSEHESNNYMGCNAGFAYIAINSNGAVTPCVSVPMSFGNVRTDSILNIFHEMGRYFKSSGRTCYGRSVAAMLAKQLPEHSSAPTEPEISKSIAENHIIKNNVSSISKEVANIERIH